MSFLKGETQGGELVEQDPSDGSILNTNTSPTVQISGGNGVVDGDENLYVFEGGVDANVARYDDNLNLVWDVDLQTSLNTGASFSRGGNITTTTDYTWVCAETAGEEVYVVRLNKSDGSTSSQEIYSNNQNENTDLDEIEVLPNGNVAALYQDPLNNEFHIVEFDLSLNQIDDTVFTSDSGVPIDDARVTDNGDIVLAGDGMRKYTKSGTLEWSNSGWHLGLGRADDGTLYVYDNTSNVLQIDPSDGSTLNTISVAEDIRGYAGPNPGEQYTGCYDGSDYGSILTSNDGTERWRNIPAGAYHVSHYPDYRVYSDAWATIEQITTTQVAASSSMNATTLSESLTSTQVASSASMNTPVAAFTEPITATQVAAAGAANTATLTSLTLDSTQVAASAVINTSTVTNLTLDAAQVASTTTMESPTTLFKVSLVASQPAATGAANTGTITSFNLLASQPAVTADMNGISIGGTDVKSASQPAATASMNTPTLIENPVISATQLTASSSMNTGDIFTEGKATATQTAPSASMNSTSLIDISKIFRGLGDTNEATVQATDNNSTLQATANEVE